MQNTHPMHTPIHIQLTQILKESHMKANARKFHKQIHVSYRQGFTTSRTCK